jgi:hypothetical protein
MLLFFETKAGFTGMPRAIHAPGIPSTGWQFRNMDMPGEKGSVDFFLQRYDLKRFVAVGASKQ